MQPIHAIYENGVFRPTVPVSFPEHSEVEIEARLINGQLVQDLDAIYAVMARATTRASTTLPSGTTSTNRERHLPRHGRHARAME